MKTQLQPKGMVYAIWLIIQTFHQQYVLAQAPSIEWQNVIGGTGFDWARVVEQTDDGGYIMGGYSTSDSSGDKTENAPTPGMPHIWIVKTNATGTIEWDNTIGSTGQDDVNSLFQTADGGYFVAGFSYGEVFADKTEPSEGLADYWVLKLNASGVIEWQNTIGGTNYDFLFPAFQTSDGGYYIGGYSNSEIGGDKTEASFGLYDYWVLKLDALGNILWQKTIGGSSNDYLYSMQETPGGGLLLGGHSNSGVSGLKTEPSAGGYDYWVVKLDAAGDIEWQNTIGGSLDETNRPMVLTPDGGCVIGGWSLSGMTGDKSEVSQGNRDYWVVKLDSTGNIVWQNGIGGAADDYLYDIQYVDGGGYLLGGYSNSAVGGDKSEASEGLDDFWAVKLDDDGNILWQSTLGGSGLDRLQSVDQSADGGYMLVGYSSSGISGDVTDTPVGGGDYWMVKLNPEGPVEVCNGIDDDDDGFVDEDLPLFTYYLDVDGDGYGDAEYTIETCEATAPGGYAANGTDCNGLDPGIHPGAPELCNGGDDDCDGLIDEGFTVYTYYLDIDGDGYGVSEWTIETCELTPPGGYSSFGTDCNGYEASIHPGAPELCNGGDDDCDGLIDEDFPVNTYYLDIDGDGYGVSEWTIETCELTPPGGYSEYGTDCNGYEASIYPGAPEICNGGDDDCDGLVDEDIITTISISASGPTTFCQGSSVTLTATHNGTTLQWQLNGTNIPGATGASLLVTKKGNYTCQTTSVCGTATSSPLFVNVYKRPAAVITAGGPTAFCAGGSVVLTANTGPGLNYQWYKGAIPIAGATSISYTATTPGNYKCLVTKASTGCSKMSNVIAVSIVCREGGENALVYDFNVYPNPATTDLVVELNSTGVKWIYIYNSIGQLVDTYVANENNITLSIIHLPAGPYYVAVQNDYSISSKQFIKQ